MAQRKGKEDFFWANNIVSNEQIEENIDKKQ